MADLARKVENDISILHELVHRFFIAHIRNIDLDLVFDLVEIKKIPTVIRNERVDDRDICAECNEAVCEIAADKSSTTSN